MRPPDPCSDRTFRVATAVDGRPCLPGHHRRPGAGASAVALVWQRLLRLASAVALAFMTLPTVAAAAGRRMAVPARPTSAAARGSRLRRRKPHLRARCVSEATRRGRPRRPRAGSARVGSIGTSLRPRPPAEAGRDVWPTLGGPRGERCAVRHTGGAERSRRRAAGSNEAGRSQGAAFAGRRQHRHGGCGAALADVFRELAEDVHGGQGEGLSSARDQLPSALKAPPSALARSCSGCGPSTSRRPSSCLAPR